MKKRVLFTLACLFLWTGMAMAQVSRLIVFITIEQPKLIRNIRV